MNIGYRTYTLEGGVDISYKSVDLSIPASVDQRDQVSCGDQGFRC